MGQNSPCTVHCGLVSKKGKGKTLTKKVKIRLLFESLLDGNLHLPSSRSKKKDFQAPAQVPAKQVAEPPPYNPDLAPFWKSSSRTSGPRLAFNLYFLFFIITSPDTR